MTTPNQDTQQQHGGIIMKVNHHHDLSSKKRKRIINDDDFHNNDCDNDTNNNNKTTSDDECEQNHGGGGSNERSTIFCKEKVIMKKTNERRTLTTPATTTICTNTSTTLNHSTMNTFHDKNQLNHHKEKNRITTPLSYHENEQQEHQQQEQQQEVEEDETSRKEQSTTTTTAEKLRISTNGDQTLFTTLDDKIGGFMNHSSIHNDNIPSPSQLSPEPALQQQQQTQSQQQLTTTQTTAAITNNNTIILSSSSQQLCNNNNTSTTNHPIGLTTPPYHHHHKPDNRSCYLRHHLSINSKFYSNNNNNGSQSQNEPSQTQTTADILTQNQELTQLFCDDDDDDNNNNPNAALSPLPPYSPGAVLRIPWGRLLPCSPSTDPPLPRFDLLPRKPTTPTGSSISNRNRSSETNYQQTRQQQQQQQHTTTQGGVSILGLDNIRSSDHFNEYSFGRSNKCDLSIVQPKIGTIRGDNDPMDDNTKKKFISRLEWAYGMISNRHCRIYCTLDSKRGILPPPKPTFLSQAVQRNTNTTIPMTTTTTTTSTTPSSSSSFDVYIEDCSGNGTIINKTIVLRKGEKRLLHSGDEICFVNPTSLRKTMRSNLDELLQHFSYIFVNCSHNHHHQHQYPNNNGIVPASLSSQIMIQHHSNNDNSGNITGQVNYPRQIFQQQPPFGNTTNTAISSGTANSSNMNLGMTTVKSEMSASRRPTAAVDVRSTKHPRHFGVNNQFQLMNKDTNNNYASDKENGNSHYSFPIPPLPSRPFSKYNNDIGFSNIIADKPSIFGKPNVSTNNNSKNKLVLFNNKEKDRRIEVDYDIRDMLGKGTVGNVHRAIHRVTGIERAVKIIPMSARYRMNNNNNNNNNANNIMGEQQQQFQAEVMILQNLQHPYIVKLIDVYVTPNVAVYIVMELVYGGDLFDRIIQKNQYTEIHSRQLMRRVLSAIYYLHVECNVVHRDLKPENILCVSNTNDIDIKITDFGLAKNVTGNEDALKTFCGTPQYFAPEVLKRCHTVTGRGRYGKPADMWSLGVLLYVLLSGTPPFDVEFDSVEHMIIDFPNEYWENVSNDAKDFVLKLLVKDPTKRYTITQACEHKWILTPDGDTHVHPLDDPQLLEISKKQLFKPMDHENSTGQHDNEHHDGGDDHHDNFVNNNTAKQTSKGYSSAHIENKTPPYIDVDMQSSITKQLLSENETMSNHNGENETEFLNATTPCKSHTTINRINDESPLLEKGIYELDKNIDVQMTMKTPLSKDMMESSEYNNPCGVVKNNNNVRIPLSHVSPNVDGNYPLRQHGVVRKSPSSLVTTVNQSIIETTDNIKRLETAPSLNSVTPVIMAKDKYFGKTEQPRISTISGNGNSATSSIDRSSSMELSNDEVLSQFTENTESISSYSTLGNNNETSATAATTITTTNSTSNDHSIVVMTTKDVQSDLLVVKTNNNRTTTTTTGRRKQQNKKTIQQTIITNNGLLAKRQKPHLQNDNNEHQQETTTIIKQQHDVVQTTSDVEKKKITDASGATTSSITTGSTNMDSKKQRTGGGSKQTTLANWFKIKK